MSIDRGVLDQQLQSLGEGSSWWERRELRDLPTVMHEDERVLAISRGKLARPSTVRRPWLFVVTDRRLLCLRSAGTSGWRQIEAFGHQITRTGLRVGPFHARVLVVTGERTWRLRVPRADGAKLLSALSRIGSSQTIAGSGPTFMIRRVFNHMLDLPAIALDPGTAKPPALPPPSAVDDRVESLEQEVERLREHLQFLEQLMQQKHETELERLGTG
jgi:hypothetical protein